MPLTSSSGAPPRPSTPRRAVVASGASLALGMLPLFLVGALSTSIGDDLGFGPAGTGVAIAAFFSAGGIAAVPVGWLTERLGAPAAMRLGAVVSGLSAISIGWLADSLTHVVVALAVAGISIGFVDTGASAWFAAVVPPARRGLAFGYKEASVPSASLLAGLSLPVLASTFDWRAVFLLAGASTPIVWLLVPRRADAATTSDDTEHAASSWAPLVLFALGIAAGTAAATSGSTFLVPALEDRGWDASPAGVVLAVASVASITVRILLGGTSDRRPRAVWHLVVGAMLAGGAGGALLAADLGDAVSVVGAIAIIGLGWGWTGLAFHAVLVATPGAPAVGAGLVLGGLSLGGAAGPIAFGSLSSAVSFDAAWAAGAVALVVAAACTETARRMLPA